jgi:hypothetical protein
MLYIRIKHRSSVKNFINGKSPRKDEIMKETKNTKNQSTNQQTPPPAVPNRAHTEMKNESKNQKNSNSQNNKNCK